MKSDIVQLKKMVKASNWSAAAAYIEAEPQWTHELYPQVCGIAWRVYLQLGDKVRAEDWLEQALRMMPEVATWQRGKGDFHRDRKEWQQAATHYARAAELRTDVASFHASHAYVLEQCGQLVEAAEVLESALTIDDKNRANWLRKAQILVRLGKKYDAEAAYGTALKLEDDPIIRAIHEELRCQINNGSQAASENYYDAVYSSSQKYAEHGSISVYRPVWERIIPILQKREVHSVLDLGCGPGQFAEFLAEKLPNVAYHGVDFSSVAIEQASMRCPHYTFEQRSLPITDFSNLPTFDAVLCTEVLEHVEQDCEILAALPENTFTIVTMPNFHSFGHLRVFESETAVRERYDNFLCCDFVTGIPLSSNRFIWLLQGSKK